MKHPLILLMAIGSSLLAGAAWATPVKVACVGDSITYGVGAQKGWSYPAQLQRILGPGYDVANFGVSGATLLRAGDRPYFKQKAFAAALAFKPDIVVLMLGTNDTKPKNWTAHSGEFETDYRWLVAQLQGANPAARIYLCRPTWVAGQGRYGINEPVLEKEIPVIDAIASSLHLPEIDMNAALKDHPEDLVDTVHPSTAGATLMAKAASLAITGSNDLSPVPPPSPAPIATP